MSEPEQDPREANPRELALPDQDTIKQAPASPGSVEPESVEPESVEPAFNASDDNEPTGESHIDSVQFTSVGGPDGRAESTAQQTAGSGESGTGRERWTSLQSKTLRRFIETEERNKNWPVNFVAAATFLSGLVGAVQPLFTRLSQPHPRIMSALVPYEYYAWNKSFTVAFGLFLIYVSINLLKRKRVAWMLAVTGNVLSAVIEMDRTKSEHTSYIASHLIDVTLPGYAVIPPLLTLILLIVFRKNFPVQSEKSSIKVALLVIVACSASMLIYGSLGFWLLDPKDFGINFQFTDALVRTLRLMTFQGNADLTPHTHHAEWFLDSLQLYGALAFSFGSISLFRPLHYRWNTAPRERNQAEALLNAHGRTSLDSYKLLQDKSYFFSNDQSCFVAYRGAFGIALALSDPTGPFDKLSDIVRQFREASHRNGWQCAFLQTTPETVPIFEQLKFERLKIGEDAIVELENFAIKVVKKKTFKSPLKKLEKDGYTVTKFSPPHSNELIASVKEVSDQWLALPGRRERGFSLGAFNVDELNRTAIFAVQDSTEKIIAFVNQVRSYRESEATVDLMRHRETVPNGVMDFLFAKTLLMLKDEGFKFFSLGLAALSGVGEQPGASLEEKTIKQIYENMNRFFSYKGLRAYKDKFDPVWEDRFLIYEGGPAGLLRTTAALARVTEGSADDDD